MFLQPIGWVFVGIYSNEEISCRVIILHIYHEKQLQTCLFLHTWIFIGFCTSALSYLVKYFLFEERREYSVNLL